MQMRVQLAILLSHRARAHDAELATLQIQRLAREHLAVALHDHPRVEHRMKLADVVTEALVEWTVDRGAGLLAVLLPARCVAKVFARVDSGRTAPGAPTPLPGRVERARESSEQIRLQ